MYLHIILNLLLVIAAIMVYLFINWRFTGKNSGKSKSLEILSMLPLGSKEKLVIVRAESQKLLIGVTAGSINILAALTDEPYVAAQDKYQQEINRALEDYVSHQPIISKDLQ